MKLTLKLKNPGEIKRFVEITSQYGEDLSLVHNRYVVDAKSILGIFSMDLSRPIDLVSDVENENLKNDLKDFVVA
ncbi:HPr family phosphocarrier protein [Eubacteriales bacterium OttesenSCG-928-N13]|nr:HPr family phosphocarrier protein [Eubacteriales bacterium OttesenSCG-928-N13]